MFLLTELQVHQCMYLFSIMSKENVRKQVLEKNRTLKQKEKPGQSFISKHLKKVYPLGIQKSNSSQSLSSLSQNSSDSVSFINGSITPRDRPKTPMSPTRKIPRTPMSLVSELRPLEKEKPVPVANNVGLGALDSEDGNLKRCHWITKNSDKTYVQFHDECWGVPVYDDIQLFELLALSGMLMYHLWAEIIKRKEQYREAFARFDPNFVAKFSEKEIKEISSNKDLELVESQVRCIVDNAKCLLQVVKEFGSFSSYLWGYMNYTPTINRYRYPKSVPLRSMKSEAVSRDLLRRGFRFAGPIIVYSFMQAAGMTVDHLVDCFRFTECVNLVEKRYGCGTCG